MRFSEFSKALDDLENNLHQLTHEDLEPIYDGPLNREAYHHSKLRIVWLLKEPYGREDAGSRLEEWFGSLTFFSGKISPTWKRVTYVTHGVLSNRLWNEMDDYNPEMKKELKVISWLNVQKVPLKDSSNTNDSDITEVLKNPLTFDIIKSQLELLKPDVIICGNTFKFLCNNLLQSDYICSYEDADCRLRNKQIIIDAYHPSKPRGLKQEEKYVDSIIKAVNHGLSIR